MNEQQQQFIEMVDERGELGILDVGNTAPDTTLLAVRLGDGVRVFVAAEQVLGTNPNKLRYAGLFETLRRQAAQIGQALTAGNVETSRAENGDVIVPVIAEEIVVGKKIVETGGVRIHKNVREDVQIVDEITRREDLQIERVPINQFVETAPGVRYEGETMIIPVLEEVVVTQKRLLVREEIRVTKTILENSQPQEFVVRREEINLEKIAPDASGE